MTHHHQHMLFRILKSTRLSQQLTLLDSQLRLPLLPELFRREGQSQFIENNLLFLPLFLHSHILQRITVNNYIFTTNLLRYLLILSITQLLTTHHLLMTMHYRFKHSLPILLPLIRPKLLYRLLQLQLLLHPLSYHPLHKIKILLTNHIQLPHHHSHTQLLG
jgi:hypothetical protein